MIIWFWIPEKRGINLYHNTNFFCTYNRNCENVNKLLLDKKVQDELSEIFTKQTNKWLNGTLEFIEFDGRYRPEKNELLYIKEFSLPKSIGKSIRQPISTQTLGAKSKEKEYINSIFAGQYNDCTEDYIISFQNFLPNQILSRNSLGIIMYRDTFNKIDDLALSVKEQVDCIYKNQTLYFSSYWIARQIFDLSEYYQTATDKDIELFIRRSVLKCDNIEQFNDNVDDWIRRKIALIEDSKVLEKCSVNKIAEIATAHNVTLALENDRILIPNDKQKLKDLLRFLDEDKGF